MGDKSAIEWTDATWNPTTGCDRVSPGCDNCYALSLARRLKAMGQPKYQLDGNQRTSGPGFGLQIHPDTLDIPRGWTTPRRVFVDSMSDLFHPAVPEKFISDVFEVMANTPRHTYQVLTKRPQRAAALAAKLPWPESVWLGTSVECDPYVWRARTLASIPAAVRFVSCEPLLSPLPSLELDDIDWIIVGGESGAGCRPMDPSWVRELRDRSNASGVAFFFKQWGGRTPKSGGRVLDGRTWDEMPTGKPRAEAPARSPAGSSGDQHHDGEKSRASTNGDVVATLPTEVGRVRRLASQPAPPHETRRRT